MEDPYSDLKAILKNEELLETICKKGEELAEFPRYLFDFFAVFDQSLALMKWAFQREIRVTSNSNQTMITSEHWSEAFRSTSLATRLLSNLFFGELGKKYLKTMLSPIIDGVLMTEDYSHPIHQGWATISEKKRYLKLFQAKLFIYKDAKVEKLIKSFDISNCSVEFVNGRRLELVAEKEIYQIDCADEENAKNWLDKISKLQESVQVECVSFAYFQSDSHEKTLKIAMQFVNALFDSTNICPLFIRQSLQLLQQAIEKAFPEIAEHFLLSILFIRFICPALVSPAKYELLEEGNCLLRTYHDLDQLKKITPKNREGFVQVSKVFVFVVNSDEETLKSVSSSDSEKRYSKGFHVEEIITAEYLQESKKKLISFAAQLVNENDVKKLSKLIQSNITNSPKIVSLQQEHSTKDLYQYLTTYHIPLKRSDSGKSDHTGNSSRSSFDSASDFSDPSSNNTSLNSYPTIPTTSTAVVNVSSNVNTTTVKNGEFVNIEAQAKAAVEAAKDLFKNTSWKLERSKKGGTIKQYVLPSQDTIWFLRVEMIVPVPKKVWDHLHRSENFHHLMKNAASNSFYYEELFSAQNRVDLYLAQKLPFPLSTRDFVISHQFCEDFCGNSADIQFSIERPDKKPLKKNVRGDLIVINVCVEDPQNPNQIKLVNMVRAHLKGNIPAWIINGSGANQIKVMKKDARAHVEVAKQLKLL